LFRGYFEYSGLSPSKLVDVEYRLLLDGEGVEGNEAVGELSHHYPNFTLLLFGVLLDLLIVPSVYNSSLKGILACESRILVRCRHVRT